MRKLAVIDLGSNSVRMSIFGIAENGILKTLKNYRKTIRLSQGMTADMLLQKDAQMRAAATFMEYRKILDAEKISEVFAVATAAVRKAKNRNEFLELIKGLCNIEIRVIDGKTEAKLDALAVKKLLSCENGIICDIGGGSTEVIGVTATQSKSLAVSIPFGSRGIHEMFLLNGESPEALTKAECFVRSELEKIPFLSEFYGSTVIGIGGTLRAAAKFSLADSTVNPIDRCEISAENMQKIVTEIIEASIPQRMAMPGIGEERADIISGGLIFIKCLSDLIAPKNFVIADVGVREGVLFDVTENSGILNV